MAAHSTKLLLSPDRELLLARPATARVPRAAILAVALFGWGSVLTLALLTASSCRWHPSSTCLHTSPYSFTTTTIDAAATALLSVLIGSVLLCSFPMVAATGAAAISVAAVTKFAMLGSDVPSAARAAVAFSAVAPAAITGAALLLRVEDRRRLRARQALPHMQGSVVPLVSSTDGGGGGRGNQRKRGASLGRMLGLARPEVPLLGVGTLALLFSSSATMALPALVGNMLGVISDGSVSKHEQTRRLTEATLTLAIIFACGGVASAARGYIFTFAGERVVARLRTMLFNHLVVQDISFFDKTSTGELMNRLASDTTVLQNAITVNVSMGLRFVAQVLIGLLLIFIYSWKLSLVMLSVVPLVVFTGVFYGRFMKRQSKLYQAALSDAAASAQEAFAGIRTVRSFATEPREAERYAAAVGTSFAIGKRKAFAYGIFGGIIGTVGQGAVLLVLWFGGTLVIRGEIKLADLTSFLLLTISIAASLGVLSNVFSAMMSALGANSRVFALLDTMPGVPTTGGATLPALRGLLELEDVSFAYPTRPDSRVLQSVSLTVQPGTVVALCGPSGAGKSTLIGLLERWYEPASGAIRVDGVALATLDPSWWRRQLALVAQEPVLFACSIRDNIAYGSASASHAAIEAAARTANAHDFVTGFPGGYDTPVGERGVQLSGGQKQRVAIARALLVDPKVLLLDEATSALDSESERLVQEAIDRLMAERTTLVIAHRLSTVFSADCICVVSGGTIAERGTHAELVAKKGIYKTLVHRQLAAPGPDA